MSFAFGARAEGLEGLGVSIESEAREDTEGLEGNSGGSRCSENNQGNGVDPGSRPLRYQRPKKGLSVKESRHLFLFNVNVKAAGELTGADIRAFFSQFGEVESVQPVANTRFTFLSYESLSSALEARRILHNRVIPELGFLPGAPIRVEFTALLEEGPQEDAEKPLHMKDISVLETRGVEVSGLTVVEDFVSEEEETQLMAEVDEKPWTMLKVRRVQQYGFEFAYSCRNVNASAPIDPLPRLFRQMAHRITQRNELGMAEIDQLTVNDYPVGAGIGSHIDTHSAFEEGIASLSLGSSCVMVFMKKGQSLAHPEQNSPANHRLAKAVFLPRRSLAILTGEARYIWSHGIPFRASDVNAQGEELERDRRVSLTYRKARGRPCTCPYSDACADSAQNTSFPLTESSEG